jgi:sugar/nucleoside kinase (ribokinase family)
MSELSILTIGDSTIDKIFSVDRQNAALIVNKRNLEKEICFNYGEKIPITDIKTEFGGSALNTAVGFGRLGIKTHISTIVGNDEEGKEILKFLNNNKIQLGGSAVAGNTNQAFIVLYDGERTIFSFHEKRDYKSLRIPQTQWIYFASAAKGSDILVDKMIDRAKEGTKVIFNPGSYELERFDLFKPMLKHLEFLILNKDEADFILGRSNMKLQLKKLHEMGVKNIVITAGKNGAYISGEKQFHMDIFASEVVDPTGAGDAFSCGFAGAIMNQKSLVSAAKWGMINSSSVISTFGATKGLLSARQIEQILIKTYSLTENKI